MASWDRFNEGLFYEWSVCTKGVEEHNSRGIIRRLFFRKCDSFFKSPKKIFQKNYPELEI